jgi:hypothetical protein
MPAGASRKGVVDAAPPEPSLPKNCTELRAIAEESITQGRFVDIIGLVKDCRLPIPTNGSGELKRCLGLMSNLADAWQTTNPPSPCTTSPSKEKSMASALSYFAQRPTCPRSQ